MASFYMLIGASGCGKSTYAERLPFHVVSTDSIRRECFGDEDDQQNPELVFDIAHDRVVDFLSRGEDVIFDATNVSFLSRQSIIDRLPSDCKKISLVFFTPPDVCIDRQNGRKRKVPDCVVKKQYSSLLKWANTIPDQFDIIVVAEPPLPSGMKNSD